MIQKKEYLTRLCICVLLSVLFSSCHEYSEVETTVTCTSYCNQLYHVEVYTWVRRWNGYPITLEYHKWISNVPYEKIDSAKNALMPGAIEVKNKVDACLQNIRR